MPKYVVVDNRPNRIATIHVMSCRCLGEKPLNQTDSATRTAFDDGLQSLEFASEIGRFGFCSHCLKKYKLLLAEMGNES